MDAEVQASHKALKELRVNGKIAQMVIARKGHKCSDCGLPIEPGTEYYRVYLGGAGLGNLKYPEHTHIHCFLKENNKCH